MVMDSIGVQVPEYQGLGIRVRIRVQLRNSVGMQIPENWGAGFRVRLNFKLRAIVGAHVSNYF